MRYNQYYSCRASWILHVYAVRRMVLPFLGYYEYFLQMKNPQTIDIVKFYSYYPLCVFTI